MSAAARLCISWTRRRGSFFQSALVGESQRPSTQTTKLSSTDPNGSIRHYFRTPVFVHTTYTPARFLYTSVNRDAGHNKWSKIKRKKSVTDLQKSKLRGKLSDQIRSAVLTGGNDPNTNIKLAGLLTQARSSGVPKSGIESALAGKGGGVARETVVYEGKGPSGYLVIIEALTDNRKRTRPEIKLIIDKQGGMLGEPGSSAFMFDQKGIIDVLLDGRGGDDIDPMELAIEVGAEDVQVLNEIEREEEEGEGGGGGEGGRGGGEGGGGGGREGGEEERGKGRVIQLKCEPNELNSVSRAVQEKGLAITSASVIYLPTSWVPLNPEQYKMAEKMIDLLNDQSEVVAVHTNHELSS